MSYRYFRIFFRFRDRHDGFEPIPLKHLANHGHKGAKRVERLLARPDRLIGLILIGNNLVNILASAIATILGMRLYGDIGVAMRRVH